MLRTARRYRETCINAYLFRRQRSLGFVYNGGMPGNIYSNPEIGTSVLFQEAWSFAVATSDLIANLDPAKWNSGQYIVGAAPAYQYDGAGNIKGFQAAGPPAVRVLSVPITYNIDKPHSIVMENVGIVGPTSASAGQSNVSLGIESAAVLAINPVHFIQTTNGNAVDHSGATFAVNLNGTITTYTGLQYWVGLAGGTLKMIMGAWNGTNRQVLSYLNGKLIDSQVSTIRGNVANKSLKIVLGQGDHEGVPATINGRITFKGFSA